MKLIMCSVSVGLIIINARSTRIAPVMLLILILIMMMLILTAFSRKNMHVTSHITMRARRMRRPACLLHIYCCK